MAAVAVRTASLVGCIVTSTRRAFHSQGEVVHLTGKSRHPAGVTVVKSEEIAQKSLPVLPFFEFCFAAIFGDSHDLSKHLRVFISAS